MRIAKGGLKNKYEKNRVFFLKKNIKIYLFSLPPRPPGPSLVLVLLLGASLYQMGGCGGPSGALCALGLDAPWLRRPDPPLNIKRSLKGRQTLLKGLSGKTRH
jgi:hypothetical protein